MYKNKSLLDNIWFQKNIDERKVLYFSQKFNFSNFLSKLLVSINISQEEIDQFLNPDIINNRYDNIELFMNDNFYEDIRKHLTKINDLDKSLRKFNILNMYERSDLFSDYIGYDYVNKLIDLIQQNDRIDYSKYNDDFNKFKEYYDFLTKTFNFDNFDTISNTIEKSLFVQGIYSDIDNLEEIINEKMNNIQKICERFSKFIDEKNKQSVRYEYNDKDDHFLVCTKKRYMTIEKKISKY